MSEAVEETEGNELKLEGRVSGSQPLTVAWYKNNQEVHSSAHCEISFKNNALLLHIKTVEQSDAGLYTCKVSNEAGITKSDSGEYVCKASNAAGTDTCKSKGHMMKISTKTPSHFVFCGTKNPSVQILLYHGIQDTRVQQYVQILFFFHYIGSH
uniref:Ig-like domain-containing protein n=1 Tax=Malurus cyaneus samueli TaxID=2593467 RepID=A0A8C5TU59_9PASS